MTPHFPKTETRLAGILKFTLVTAAPDRLARFYQAIGFDLDDAHPVPAEDCIRIGLTTGGFRRPMRYGNTRVDLEWTSSPARPFPADQTATSLSFQHFALTTEDIQKNWNTALQAGASPISQTDPVTLPPSSGGVTAAKFRDPEGHPLEFLQFPNAKPKEINHSAVTAADASRSIAFWETLGLSVKAHSFNTGPEQDALDDIQNAQADVIALYAGPAQPHLELLAYRIANPQTPPQHNVTDVAATRMVWQGNTNGLFRDPDGHLHEVVPSKTD